MYPAHQVLCALRLTSARRRPSLRSRPLPLSRQPSEPSASAAVPPGPADRRSPCREDRAQHRQRSSGYSSAGSGRPRAHVPVTAPNDVHRPPSAGASQQPRPSSGRPGRAASPPRLGRHHSSSCVRPPSAQQRRGLELTRSKPPAAGQRPWHIPSSEPAQPRQPSVWSRLASGPSQPWAPSAGTEQQPWQGAPLAAAGQPPIPEQSSVAPRPLVVNPYAAVYGSPQQQQPPALQSWPQPDSAPSIATHAPWSELPPAGTPSGAGAAAAAGSRGDAAGNWPGGLPAGEAEGERRKRAGNSSDDNSSSMTAVRDSDGPGAAKRRRLDSSAPLAANSRQSNNASGHPDRRLESRQSRAAPSQSSVPRQGAQGSSSGLNEKQKAFAEVKALLSPLLPKGLVSREEYKAVAKAATHILYRKEGAGIHDARQALGKVLSEMDLPRAAVAILQET